MPYDPADPAFHQSVLNLQAALAAFERCLADQEAPERRLRIYRQQDADQKLKAMPEAEKQF